MLFAIRAAADVDNEPIVRFGGSTLPIRTGTAVNLTRGFPSSRLPIRTGTAVNLTVEFQPDSVNVATGVTVAVTASTQPGQISVVTGTSMALAAASSSRLAIATGTLVRLNGTQFRPIATGITVSLTRAQLPGAITIGTGITVSLTAAGNAAFGFTRDLVIAGQADLAADILSEPVLLGIEFTDLDFRSVANGGRFQQTGAEDLQFALISTGAVLSHNIVSHDPVSGRLVFDLKLPAWTATQDVPVRMSYGFVGQMTGSIGITTGIDVALTPPWFELPRRSGRASASGTSFWYDRPPPDDDPTAVARFAAEEADVALIDAMCGSSKGANRANVDNWTDTLGTGNNTQLDWRTTTDFGFGHCVSWLPTGGQFTAIGSGWLFFVMQTVPHSADTRDDPDGVWNEILNGDHDAEYTTFGARLAARIDLTGHPRQRFVVDANHEMNQSNDYQVFNATRNLYKRAMERTIDLIRTGAGFHVRFCHRPAFHSDEGDAKVDPFTSYIPDNVDVLALSLHPGAETASGADVDALFAGTLSAEFYGVTNDLIPAALARGLPIAFPEFSPKFNSDGFGLCPVANIFMTRFFNNVVVPARTSPGIVCDCVWNQNIRDVGAYEGTGSGDTQWDAMVADRKTLWSGTKSNNIINVIPMEVVNNPGDKTILTPTIVENGSNTFNIAANTIVDLRGQRTLQHINASSGTAFSVSSAASTSVLCGGRSFSTNRRYFGDVDASPWGSCGSNPCRNNTPTAPFNGVHGDGTTGSGAGGNYPAIRIDAADANFKMQGFYCKHTMDGFTPTARGNFSSSLRKIPYIIENACFMEIRDDCISNDSQMTVTFRNCYFQGHVWLSVRPGDPGPPGPEGGARDPKNGSIVTFENCLIHMDRMLWIGEDDRGTPGSKRANKYISPTQRNNGIIGINDGPGMTTQHPIKTAQVSDSGGLYARVIMRNSVLCIDTPPCDAFDDLIMPQLGDGVGTNSTTGSLYDNFHICWRGPPLTGTGHGAWPWPQSVADLEDMGITMHGHLATDASELEAHNFWEGLKEQWFTANGYNAATDTFSWNRR